MMSFDVVACSSAIQKYIRPHTFEKKMALAVVVVVVVVANCKGNWKMY